MCQLGLKVTHCFNANLFTWRRALCCFQTIDRPILYGRRLSAPIHRKANRRHSHRSATRSAPIIYSHGQLFIEGAETDFFVSAERNKKSPRAPTGTTPALSPNRRCRNWRWQTQCCLHLQGEAWGGSSGWLPPSALKAQCTQHEMKQIFWCDSDFRRDWEMWGRALCLMCDRSGQCVVTHLSNKQTFLHCDSWVYFSHRRPLRPMPSTGGFIMWWGSDTFLTQNEALRLWFIFYKSKMIQLKFRSFS